MLTCNYAFDVLPLVNKDTPVGVSLFNLTSHIKRRKIDVDVTTALCEDPLRTGAVMAMKMIQTD